MFQKLFVVLALAGIALIASAETVYKWVDGAGQVHYTDLPPRQADAKVLGVFENVAAMDEEDAGSADSSGYDQGDDQGDQPPAPTGNESDQPPVSQADVAAVNAEVAAARNTKCKEAQDRYQRYLESRRLFRQTADGKREYLTDQELTEARVRAKQSVTENCS